MHNPNKHDMSPLKQFTCPMHPEVLQNEPGKCPKCNMNLVLKGKVTHAPAHHAIDDRGLGPITWKSYLPLGVIVGLILLTTVTIALRDWQLGTFDLATTISYFMIGFFLVFSGFKLMDIKGFAEGYFTYDLLAQRWPGYGYIYPFIELSFGLAMILLPHTRGLLWTELIVMAFSGLGVAIKLAKREKFQCACLGTFLKVPLTKVTLIEDFGMAFLALILLFIA